MTADSTRRLSSMDLFDDDEHDQLDEWSNRAVLTEPLGASASIPGVVRCAGGPRPGGGGGDLRGPVDDLPGTR